jgi:hypothetical protein
MPSRQTTSATLATCKNRSNGGQIRLRLARSACGHGRAARPSRALPKTIGERSGSSGINGLGARTGSLGSSGRSGFDRARLSRPGIALSESLKVGPGRVNWLAPAGLLAARAADLKTLVGIFFAC